MPITPLHFGLMAPIRHAAPRKVSVISFVLVNLWIDQPAITNWFMGLPLPSHAGYDQRPHQLAPGQAWYSIRASLAWP